MKRVRLCAAVAATAALGLGTVAVAQTDRTNEYVVEADVVPNVVGTKAKPAPVGLEVGWTMSEASGLRPETVETYTINVYGGRENTDLFPTCTATEINNVQSDADCDRKAQFGSGFLVAKLGADNQPGQMSITCRVPIKLYNGGNARAAVFVRTSPPACPVNISQAIDARFVPAFGKKGRGLRFSVPANLRHPIPGLSLAVTEVQTKLPRKTTKVKGRTRGFLESTVPCQNGERFLEVEFVTEEGSKATARDTKPCP